VIVPDASAVGEVLLRTSTGRALASRLSRERLVAPEVLDVEVASLLRRALSAGRLSTEAARERLRVLEAWPIRRVGLRTIVGDTQPFWANVSVHDACYVVVAQAFDATILTVDGKLARAQRLGVPVENVTVTDG
jgi:predicted nucleic acid-binding protein